MKPKTEAAKELVSLLPEAIEIFQLIPNQGGEVFNFIGKTLISHCFSDFAAEYHIHGL